VTSGPWSSDEPYLRVGRYALFDQLAAGGMASVHVGRLMGPAGFARTVAIKRLHGRYAQDDEFITMFLDEARVAARLRHPNVVPIHDVVQTDNEVFLVMDYVEGESLSRLLKAGYEQDQPIPIDVSVAIICGALHGLHAAHETKGDDGEPLNLVHRDVSPQNIMVGVDGVPRILDFGIAKAAGRAQTTATGQVKGKLAYMAIEQLGGDEIDRRVDVYSAGVVLWEALAGRPRFRPPSHTALLALVMEGSITGPSEHRAGVPKELDDIVIKALQRDPAERFQTAREFALALERVVSPATGARIGSFVDATAREALSSRATLVARIESDPGEAGRASQRSMDELPTLVTPPEPHLIAASEEGGTLASIGLSMRTPGGNRKKLLLGALALIVGAMVAIVMLVGGHDDSNTPAAAGSTTTAPPATAALSVADVPEPDVTDDTTTTSTTSMTSTTSSNQRGTEADNSPPARRTPPARAKGNPKAKPPTTRTAEPAVPPPAPPAPNCNPPFTVDARGVQRVKPECL